MVPGAGAWQPPPEGIRGCPRVSRGLVRCQRWTDVAESRHRQERTPGRDLGAGRGHS